MSDKNQIEALISLLDDPDDFIFSEIKKKLLDIGEPAIPMLEQYWEVNPFGVQGRVENIIHEIQFNKVKYALQNWIKTGGNDLLDGFVIVNQYQYPDADNAELKAKVNQIQKDAWLELNHNLTAFEKVNVINQIIFDIYNFSGNKKHYHSPQNSFLSDLLLTKKGNPLSLSIIYLLVSQYCNVPIQGVNLPSHFVLCYIDEFKVNHLVDSGLSPDGKILFYINAFSRGTIFNKVEIERFLSQLNIDVKPEYYEPCDNVAIIKRVINNLMFSYDKAGKNDKVEEMKILLELFDA